MSDDPKKDSLGARIQSLVMSPEGHVMLGRALRAVGRAAGEHQAQRREALNRQDIALRHFGELFILSARPWSPPAASGASGRGSRTPRGPSEEPRARSEADDIGAERARMQEERRLLRARKDLARDRIELEQLRRQTERMEAAAVDLQEGRRPPDEVIAQMIEVERDVPVDADERGAADPAAPDEDQKKTLDADEARALDAFNRTTAALREGDFTAVAAHADASLAATAAFLKRFPDKTDAYQPFRQLVLYFATGACVRTGDAVRAIFLANEALEVVEVALEHGPREQVLLNHGRILALKGDAKLKLARANEAVELYQIAQATLRELANESPSQAILDELVALGQKLDRVARERRH